MQRSQYTDKEEFYSTVDSDLRLLKDSVSAWQHYYNWQRTHGSLNSLIPMEKVGELMDNTPLQEEFSVSYIPEKEKNTRGKLSGGLGDADIETMSMNFAL